MENIYILSVSNVYEVNDYYFSTSEKAIEFIKFNYSGDKPRKVSINLYEGKNNLYSINERMIDQERI